MPDADWARTVDGRCGPAAVPPDRAGRHLRRLVSSGPPVRLRQPDGDGPLRRPDVTADMVFHDPQDRWGLPRLRLPRWPSTGPSPTPSRSLSGPASTASSSTTSTACSGHQTDARWRSATSVGSPIATGAAVYVNRAFAILDALPSVEAVLVEDAAGELASPAAAAWLDDVVVPALSRARRRGARIHRLDYGNCTAAPDPTARSSERHRRLAHHLDRPPSPPLPGPVVLVARRNQPLPHALEPRRVTRTETTGDRTVKTLTKRWHGMTSRATRRDATSRCGHVPDAASPANMTTPRRTRTSTWRSCASRPTPTSRVGCRPSCTRSAKARRTCGSASSTSRGTRRARRRPSTTCRRTSPGSCRSTRAWPSTSTTSRPTASTTCG